MKRSFKLNNLGCAHCATKMEHDINKLEGVNSATISFMTSRLTIDANDDVFDDVVSQAQKICSGYESACTIQR